MVEKAGHNKMMHKARVDWINEGKPKTSVLEDGEDTLTGEETAQWTGAAPRQASRIAPIFETAATAARPKTPEADDLFGDEDNIYNATPIVARKAPAAAETAGEPDEDELDALMAESEGATRGPTDSSRSGAGAQGSIFGDGRPKSTVSARLEDEDDLDALMAEAEAAQAPSRVKLSLEVGKANNGGDEEDDLDALIAEAEAQSAPKSRHPETAKAGNSSAAKPSDANFDDDEEAMAEMEGLVR